jgi:hypothetical protein
LLFVLLVSAGRFTYAQNTPDQSLKFDGGGIGFGVGDGEGGPMSYILSTYADFSFTYGKNVFIAQFTAGGNLNIGVFDSSSPPVAKSIDLLYGYRFQTPKNIYLEPFIGPSLFEIKYSSFGTSVEEQTLGLSTGLKFVVTPTEHFEFGLKALGQINSAQDLYTGFFFVQFKL